MGIWNAIAGAPLAVFVLAAAPAHAQERWSDPGFMAAANVTVHRGIDPSRLSSHAPGMVGNFDHHDRDRRHERHGGERFDSGFAGWSWYDPNLNRSWDSDSYNDWWHDRPDRAYPRWVQHNDGCDDGRIWQGGGAWRCTW